MTEWRNVAEAPAYEVSSDGQIRRNGRLLKPFSMRSGYLLVKLSVAGMARNRLLHGLVAEAFLGPRPEGQEVNHFDGIKTNNAVSNLEYVTKSRNAEHAFELGLRKAPAGQVRDYEGTHWTTRNPERIRGENNPRAKLTAEQVSEIRRLRAEGAIQPALAKQFGVSLALISNIVLGKAWK